MRQNELQNRKEADIKRDYEALKSKRKYTTEYIIGQLCEKYYLSTRTIQAIVFGEYDLRRKKTESPN